MSAVSDLPQAGDKRNREDEDNVDENEDEDLIQDEAQTGTTYLPNTEVQVPENYQGEDESELSDLDGDSDKENAIPDDVEETEEYCEDQRAVTCACLLLRRH